MTREQATEQIERELAIAAQAMSSGNDGMARVCARRAAGVAITYWLQKNQRVGWGSNAMNLLRNLQSDNAMPEEVRNATLRLTTKVTGQFASPFPTNPIEDGRIIIDHLLKES